MNTTETTPVGNSHSERARVGNSFNDLLIARHIERYYWARGDWHVTMPKGQQIVIPEKLAPTWISGFRWGLRAKALGQ